MLIVNAFCAATACLSLATLFCHVSRVCLHAFTQKFQGFWDPLGLLKTADEARFNRLREVEVKHGRISMLAILGHLVTAAGNRLPGDIAYGVPFSSVKSGLAAFDTIPAAGSLQLVSVVAYVIFITLVHLSDVVCSCCSLV